jgi:formate dehydrogenase alpha subunit
MMTLDGHPVAARGTLLEACRAAGVEIAAFCHDERLSAGGHCRACLVEADGRLVAACTTRARDGALVVTDSERLRGYRRDLGELMLAESRPGGWVGEMLEHWGARGDRYGAAGPGAPPPDRSHPYLRLDLSRCILCRRCVRACEEIQGQFVYAVEGRGSGSRLAWGGGSFADSPCVSCGACVTACPTGAITDADRERPAPAAGATRTVRTTCSYCGVGCQLEVTASADAVLRIDGAREAAANHGHLCVKGRYAHGFARHPDRLTRPLVRRQGTLVETSWDEAIALVAREFARLRGAVAGLSSSRCTNEENYLFQKWFRAGLGSNDVDCCARVCHAPSAAGMREAFGTGAATNSLADLERADLLMVVGANVTEAHPVTGARIRQAALRGARLIVVDPRRTELAAMADVHLQVRPGANVPLFNALACALVEEGLVDHGYLAERVAGWDAYSPFIRAHTPERWEAVTGVPARLVREAARAYGRAERPFMAHGLGVTEHYQGSESVMLLCNLALLVGAVGREGVGINPLRGQNNVQGSADMGCQPDLVTGYARVDDPAVRERIEGVWGRPLPAAPGRRLPEMLDAARSGALRGLFILGEDILQTDPDSGRTRAALEALEILVVEELFLSETARLAHVVLPGASFLEKDGTFTNGERRVQRVRKVLEPPGEARADWEILSALMAASGCPQPAGSPAAVMDEVARVAPAFAGVSFARLEGDGLQWPVPGRDHPGTPILHAGGFAGGRGKLTRVDYEPSPGLGSGLTLVTGRVLEHYNAGTMTRRTPNLTLAPRDELEIHPADAAARGIEDGARVAVASAHGEARAVARVTDRVARGVLFLSFHFPETGTNAVTGEVRDRVTGCPEYKVTAVEVRAV